MTGLQDGKRNWKNGIIGFSCAMRSEVKGGGWRKKSDEREAFIPPERLGTSFPASESQSPAETSRLRSFQVQTKL